MAHCLQQRFNDADMMWKSALQASEQSKLPFLIADTKRQHASSLVSRAYMLFQSTNGINAARRNAVAIKPLLDEADAAVQVAIAIYRQLDETAHVAVERGAERARLASKPVDMFKITGPEASYPELAGIVQEHISILSGHVDGVISGIEQQKFTRDLVRDQRVCVGH